MKNHLITLIFALLVICSAVPGQSGSDKVKINFSGTSLKEVIKVFEQYTGKRFLFEESLVAGKKVNLLAGRGIPVGKLNQVLESVLEVEGLTLIESGSPEALLYKIVDIKTVTSKPTGVFTATKLNDIPSGDRVVTLVHELKYLQAEQVGAAFKNMTTVPGGVRPIAGTNLLLITDYGANVKRIGELLARVDVVGPRIVRQTIKLTNADPLELVQEIQPLLNIENRIYRAQLQQQIQSRLGRLLNTRNQRNKGGSVSSMLMDSSSPIAIAAIPRLGSVVVSATSDQIDGIVSLVNSLDIKDPAEKVVKFYVLRYQRPSALMRTLTSIFGSSGSANRARGGRRRGARSTPRNISIVPDDESSKLVVVAPERLHVEVKEVIDSLDAISDLDRELRYYPIVKGDIQNVASTISQVFQLETAGDNQTMKWARRRVRRGIVAEKKGVFAAQDMVIIDRNLNSLIIITQDEVHQRISDMIKHLDIAGPGEKEIKYYELKYARPDEVGEMLSALFSTAKPNQRAWLRTQRRGNTALDRSISVVPGRQLNTLIILAAKEIHQEITEVLARVDVAGSTLELKYYGVKHADLTPLANTIGRLFKIEVQEGSKGQQRINRRGRRGQPTTTREEPVIVPDANLQALLVLAEKKRHKPIGEMVAQLDVEGPGTRKIKYYYLKFAQPETVASTLSSLFPAVNPRQRLNRRGRQATGPDRTISLVTNTESGSVIVVATEEVQLEVAEVVSSLDVEEATLNLTYHKVQEGDVVEIAKLVGKLFKIEVSQGEQASRRRRGRANSSTGKTTGLTDTPVVIPDENLNALLVVAEQKTQVKVAAVVKQLDLAGPGRKRIEYYPLEHIKAQVAVTALESLFPTTSTSRARGRRGRQRATVEQDRSISVTIAGQTETLMVLAAGDTQREVKQVLGNIDSPGAALELRYHRIRKGDIATITQTIANLFQLEVGTAAVSRNRRGGRGRSTSQAAVKPLIVPDVNLGALLVNASGTIQDEVARVVAQLDVDGPGSRQVVNYRLDYADVQDVADALTSVYPAQRLNRRRGRNQQSEDDRAIAVVGREKTGCVMVLATGKIHQEIAGIIADLDVEDSGLQLKYYGIKNADVAEVANTLGRLFKIEVGTDMRNSRRGRRGGKASTTDEPAIIPDFNLGAVLVLTGKADHARIAKALVKLDAEGPGGRETRYYKIAQARVAEVADTLTQIFDSPSTGRRGRRGRTNTSKQDSSRYAVVVANEELSTVVVNASPAIHAEVAAIVGNLDVESLKDNVLRYYRVNNSELEEVADTVSKVFGLIKGDDRRLQSFRTRRSRGRQTDQQRSRFSQENVVLVDHNLGSLVIVAPLEMHGEIGPMLERIDSVGPGKKEIRHYRVARSSVNEIAATIASVFDLNLGNPRQRSRRTNSNQPPQTSVVIPNDVLGTIIVVAPALIQERVAQVIKQMDTLGPDENELQYYKIGKADLIEAANMLSQIFGIPVGDAETQYRRRGAQRAGDMLTKERVIIPNENLNTLLVVAPRVIQQEIAKTIERIDAVGPRDYVFRMYEVTSAEVDTAAKTISQLFDIKIMDDRMRITRSRRGPQIGPKVSATPFVLPDETLGSIIVNAPEEIHVEVKKALDKLLAIGQQEKMSIRFYKLKNTDASEVAGKLGHLFNITVGDPETTRRTTRRTSRGGSRRGRSSSGDEENEEPKPEVEPAPAAAPSAGPKSMKDFYFEGESVVVPDTNLNSVILIAPDYIHKEVETILKTLDVRRPQVLFEVAILDISSDGKLEIGTELTTIDRQGATNGRGSGFSNFGLGDRDSTVNKGFPNTTEVPTDVSGLFLGVTKGDIGNVPLLIRMLEQNTDVNIRSTPLLLVNDNQEAEFSSLEEQPTTTTSQGTATTNIAFSGFEQAGTILKITPHISEGNYIRVDIDLKVDNFYGDSPAIGIPPPRSSNQLRTTITVPDSRTVVIGGLKTIKRTVVNRGVPLLKDIPLLGYLFSSRSNQEQTSRLFLFIRPQIMDDVDFKDLNRISVDKSLEVRGITGEEIVPEDEGAGKAVKPKASGGKPEQE